MNKNPLIVEILISVLICFAFLAIGYKSYMDGVHIKDLQNRVKQLENAIHAPK